MPTTRRHSLEMNCVLTIITLCLIRTVVYADESVPGQAEFDTLSKRYTAELDKYGAKVGKGTPAEEHERFVLEYWPGNTTNPEFLTLESKYRGTVIGLSSLYQIIATGSYGTADTPSTVSVRKALTLLNEKYADHPDLDLFFFWLRDQQFAPEIKTLLKTASKSPHRHVRGTALFALADFCKRESIVPVMMAANLELLQGASGELADLEKVYRRLNQGYVGVDVTAARQAALELIDDVIKEYGDVLQAPRTSYGPIILQVERSEMDQLTQKPRRKLSELAEAMRFELMHLSTGQPAPEIDSLDAVGKPLKLTDHRGKVVVLMFSFKGCGPCEAMYPDNRKLVETYRGRPFVFLGVMGDDELATVKKSVEEGMITWPVWWDGGRPGPIAKTWNVSAWPRIFVLDHKGVIRYRELRGEILSRAVARLMKDVEQGK